MKRIEARSLLQQTRRDRRGVAAVEFALIIPVFCTILLGTLQYGVLMFTYTAMQDTARDAARKLATGTATAAVAKTEAKAALPSWVPTADWTITTTDAASGATVNASISVPATSATVLGFVLMPTTVSAQVYMRKEG